MKQRTRGLVALAGVVAGGLLAWRTLGPSRPAGGDGSDAGSGSYAVALVSAREQDRRLLIEFSTAKCPACRKMSGILADASVVAAMSDYVRVRVDGLAEPAIAERFGIERFPTYVVADGQERLIARTCGVQSADAFAEFLDRARTLPPPEPKPATAPGVTASDVETSSLQPADGSKGADPPAWIVTGKKHVVASDSVYASEAGLQMLRAGGNAVDAAVAVSFALAVTRPESTGVGGGGFMIVRLTDGLTTALDFRETAPQGASPDMFAPGGDDAVVTGSRVGHRAAATPGLVAGRCEALKRWGKLPLSTVLAPAIRLAEEGFAVDASFVAASKEALEAYLKNPSLTTSCAYVYRTFLNEGRLFPQGHVLRQPALAAFLKRLAAEGPDFFYRGEFAAALEKTMTARGGVMTAADLSSYSVKDREPLVGTYREWTVVTMPPPSSGGVAILEALNILEVYPMRDLRDNEVRPGPHLLIEAMKHAFADRARYLADADFADVPVERLTSKLYARKLAVRIQKALPGVLPLEGYGSAEFLEDGGTSHFSIIDGDGNAVVSTETINTEFGSLAAVEEWGVVLNNQMDDFAARPDQPNAFGLVQSDRNRIEPGKRPLSSMSPTIVLKDEEPCLLIGASGGPRIISGVLNVFVNLLDYGMSPTEAMTAVRLHHQWRPESLAFDAAPPGSLAELLTSKGHLLSDDRRVSHVQFIVRSEDRWIGASDPRKGGRPAGE
ncbi:MAG: hypothetical protein BroJett003_22860 [Planctomycetota bacterium]|nr:MAG: hypothetical protein BroJett003_22860 [Planctomycetota bacterium]